MGYIRVLGTLALPSLCLIGYGEAYTCTTVAQEGTTNYGIGLMESKHAELTPFPLDTYNGVISFNEDHCVQMCCEATECYVAVFDHTEALCYLKGAGAVHTYDYVKADNFTSYEMFYRQGSPEPMETKPSECHSKRGVAFDFTSADDVDALAAGTSWCYNWAPGIMTTDVATALASSGIEYIPMIWGEKDLTADRLSHLDGLIGARHLLGFNEPNFGPQANLSPAEAAALWSSVKVQAEILGADLVSPAVNFCSGDCTREDPFEWLDEFFAECDAIEGGCGVTAIAVHSYTCEAKYLNKHLYGYLKYDMPLWLTEFACGDVLDATEEGQAGFIADAMLLLELHPYVAKYAWFTARGSDDAGVTGADLLSGDGELTTVGDLFFDTYQDLQRCENLPPSLAVSTSSSSSSATSSSSSTSTSTTVPSDAVAEPGTSVGGSDVDPLASEITNVVISNVGGSGSYFDVTDMLPGADMQCNEDNDGCVKEEITVTGNLAPFDEPVTVAFRGPLNLHNIVWYEGEADSVEQTSTWTPSSSSNLVFMNNLGGFSGCSGEWTICGGSGQSYSDESGDGCSDQPEQFSGVLGSDEEVQIMTSAECGDSGTCGFYRDTGMEGWAGGDDGTKVMVFEVDMPHCGESGFSECTFNRPAVWALNAKVTRTAQYGCNCRGMGGNGGCGEFDIIECIIGSDYSDMMWTTAYDFKGTGSHGTNKYFLRPSEPTHYAAIFRGGADAYLQVVQLKDWDYSQTTITGAFLDQLHKSATEVHDIYNVEA